MNSVRICAAGLLLAALVSASPVTGGDQFLSYSEHNYAQAGKIAVDARLSDADGLVRTAADRMHAIRAFARFQIDRRQSVIQGRGPATAGGGGSPAAISEREYNDSQGWADSFTPVASLPTTETATGTSATATDYDWYSLTLPATVAATFTLNLSLTAGDFMLVNSVGSLLASGASFASLSLPVPAGTYGIRVAGAGGPYSLTHTTSAYSMPSIGSTPTTVSLATSEFKMFRVDVTGGPKHVTIRTANAVPGNTAFGLVFASWNGGSVCTTYDSSFGAGLPAYAGILPVGSYRVYVFESIGSAASVDIWVTQGPTLTIPPAPIGSSANGVYVGEETKLLYRLDIPAASRVTFRTAGGAPPAATDTRLYLLDANFDFLAFNEDAPFSFYSVLGLALPAGTYYLMSEPFPSDTGNVVITGTSLTSTPSVTLRAGSNTGFAVPADGATLFSYNPCSPVALDYTINGIGTFDPVTVLMDANGRLLGWDNDSGSRFRASFVGSTAGVSHAMVTDFSYAAGVVDVVVHPMMYTEPNGATRRLFFVDKVSNRVALFLATSTNPGFPLPPIQGSVCVGPAGLIAGPVLTMPAGQGVFSLTGYPNVTSVLFAQNVSVDTLLGSFKMTNIVD